MCGIRVTVPPIYSKILSKFPQKLSFCFAYGSSVKLQAQNVKPSMIDFVYCVENTNKWHEENLKKNSNHYSFLKFFGPKIISKVQENSGARVYFNTLVNIDDVVIKYGVVSRKDLITDLLEWSDLYLAGRLHKPVEIVRNTTNAELQTALQLNLQSAVHAALLLLPESFSEYDFYYTICNLSYGGDFRMIFGENKNKVSNIVKPQLKSFRNLYRPTINLLPDYVEFPEISLSGVEHLAKNDPSEDLLNSEYNLNCKQDTSPAAKLHHLNQLPRWPQKAITRFWNRGTVAQDTEDVLRAIAYDPDCAVIVEQCIKDIVWRSSLRQSLKGIITAGVTKSIKYSITMISDEDSSDSDSGVRFKTTNIRDKYKATKHQNQRNLHEKNNRNHDYDKSKRKYKITTNEGKDKSYSLNKSKKNVECKTDSITNKKRDLKMENKFADNSSFTNKEKSSSTKFHFHSEPSSSLTKDSSLLEKDNNSETQKQNILNLDTNSKVIHSENESSLVSSRKNIYFGPTLPPKINAVKNNDVKCNKIDTATSSTIETSIYSHEDNSKHNCSIADKITHKNDNNSLEAPDTKCRVFGPNLPENFKTIITEFENNDTDVNEIECNEFEPDDGIIGPLPIEECKNTQLEERALQIKLDLLNKSNEESTNREEWMVELPPVNSAAQVLGKRKFRTKEMPDLSDRSIWTDTAKQKTKQKLSKNSTITCKPDKNVKDLVKEKIVEKHRKNKRNKSLVDLHYEEAQKNKMKTKSDVNERRPFCRDIDLKTNHMNEAQTKAVIKKAHLLDNRFASGQSKFL